MKQSLTPNCSRFLVFDFIPVKHLLRLVGNVRVLSTEGGGGGEASPPPKSFPEKKIKAISNKDIF